MRRRDGGLTDLGELESAIMRVIWDHGSATVQDVATALERERSPAYTTVLTVMSRLAAKGLLKRRKRGRAYVYSPTKPQKAVAGTLLERLVGRLYGGSASRAIEHLIEVEAGVDDRELARLETLIRAARRRRPT